MSEMNLEVMKNTFDECAALPCGTLLGDDTTLGHCRFIILRGPGALCAYVGIPVVNYSPLIGISYNDMPDVPCHGGLTYSGSHLEGAPEGYYWFGWDYAHSGDALMFKSYRDDRPIGDHGVKWTPEMVYEDSRNAVDFIRMLYDFAGLIREKVIEEEMTCLKKKSKSR